MNAVLGSNALNSAAIQEELHRLQRENEQLREEINRVRNRAVEQAVPVPGGTSQP